MFKGFYNLTSAMLTHQRNLNVIGNNMANISTAGYKQERYTATTFDDVMYNRVGNKDGKGENIGRQSYIRATSNIYTDYNQGTLEPTGLPLDLAVNGQGFFAVSDENGEVSYTRMGSFSLDEEGYLVLPEAGRVLDMNLQPIHLGTDKVYADTQGWFHYEDNANVIAQVGLFDFPDREELDENERGFFTGADGVPMANPNVVNGYVERSNTDMVKQMTDMITVQRSLQSAAQISKMYDQLMTKASNEIGRL